VVIAGADVVAAVAPMGKEAVVPVEEELGLVATLDPEVIVVAVLDEEYWSPSASVFGMF